MAIATHLLEEVWEIIITTHPKGLLIAQPSLQPAPASTPPSEEIGQWCQRTPGPYRRAREGLVVECVGCA
jgi:hypothetical protein